MGSSTHPFGRCGWAPVGVGPPLDAVPRRHLAARFTPRRPLTSTQHHLNPYKSLHPPAKDHQRPPKIPKTILNPWQTPPKQHEISYPRTSSRWTTAVARHCTWPPAPVRVSTSSWTVARRWMRRITWIGGLYIMPSSWGALHSGCGGGVEVVSPQYQVSCRWR